MKYKTLIALIMFTLTLISFNLSAQILIRSEADSIVMNLLSNELADINIYAQKSALLNTTILPLYRELDTLSVPFNNCYMYFIDNCPEKFWSHSGRYAFVDIASSSVVIREKTRFPKDFSLLAYETKYELISYSYDPSSYKKSTPDRCNQCKPHNITH